MRRWELDVPTEDFWPAGSLEEARKLVPAGKVRIERHPTNDPVIVETWI